MTDPAHFVLLEPREAREQAFQLTEARARFTAYEGLAPRAGFILVLPPGDDPLEAVSPWWDIVQPLMEGGFADFAPVTSIDEFSQCVHRPNLNAVIVTHVGLLHWHHTSLIQHIRAHHQQATSAWQLIFAPETRTMPEEHLVQQFLQSQLHVPWAVVGPAEGLAEFSLTPAAQEQCRPWLRLPNRCYRFSPIGLFGVEPDQKFLELLPDLKVKRSLQGPPYGFEIVGVEEPRAPIGGVMLLRGDFIPVATVPEARFGFIGYSTLNRTVVAVALLLGGVEVEFGSFCRVVIDADDIESIGV
ncbi:uncharacterized protein BO97DRAFT_413438 [Aspergillus homomorphus CBS 101889]|uniref:Uncharacterized protein n=1 Tax=Aspergillus homomorphus (strain CBS 101889) TaxID=1450537 RepID=A0A395I076_ASPHC|nr:hypothetical protein BO97DRAFT_413438 [Aspergillus homomorphus CBS 101889]RAL13460.1 hypothetical protein BO97DRAFT_413438 [Aspergillus homomorphus CBS 101889]